MEMGQLSPYLWDFSGGTVLGIAVGYALKKGTKLALLILGTITIILMILSHHQYITVNWDLLTQTVEDGTNTLGAYFWSLTLDWSAKVAGVTVGIPIGWRWK